MTRLVLAASLSPFVSIPANAASPSGLKSQGYKTSGRTHSGIGFGWLVSRVGTRYFCKQRRLSQGWKNNFARSQGQPKANHVGSCRKPR